MNSTSLDTDLVFQSIGHGTTRVTPQIQRPEHRGASATNHVRRIISLAHSKTPRFETELAQSRQARVNVSFECPIAPYSQLLSSLPSSGRRLRKVPFNRL